MKTRNLILFLLVLLVIPVVCADLGCSINASCSDTSLLYLQNGSGGFDNSHAELASHGVYDNVLCCNSTFNITNDCDIGVTFLNLSNSTNAHVQDPLYDGGVNYNFSACLYSNASVTSCRVVASCSGSESCLVSVSGTTNAHVSSCGVYAFSVCCLVGVSSAVVPVVYLELPDNFDTVSSNFVNFSYNVSSGNALSNCSLIVDDDVRSVEFSPVNLVGGQVLSSTLLSGNHLWNVNCTDVFNNIGISEVRGVSVSGFDYYAVPFFILVSGFLFVLSFYLKDFFFRFLSGFVISLVSVYVFVNGVFGVEGTFVVTVVAVILAGLGFYVLGRTGLEFVRESWE